MRIKTTTETTYGSFNHQTIDGITYYTPVKSLFKVSIYRYNISGNLTDFEEYNSDKMLLRKDKNKYDEDGKIREKRRYNCHDDLGISNLKFKFEQVQTEEFDKELKLESLFNYNDRGKILESKKYNTLLNRLEKRHTYKYDQYDKILEINYFNVESEFTYNINGEEVRKKNYNPDGILKSRITFEYNQNMKVSKYYDSRGILISKNVIEYDDQGNMVKNCHYLGSGEDFSWLDKEIEYKYNDLGKLIEEKDITSQRNIFKQDYSSDNSGKQIVHNRYNPDGQISMKEEFKYNKKGCLIKEITYDNLQNERSNQMYFEYTFRYDSLTNRIEEKSLSKKRLIKPICNKYSESRYVNFDTNGNWLTKVDFIENRLCKLYLRTIEYWDPKYIHPPSLYQ